MANLFANNFFFLCSRTVAIDTKRYLCMTFALKRASIRNCYRLFITDDINEATQIILRVRSY